MNHSDSDSGDLGTQALDIAKRRQDAAKDVLALLERHFEPAETRPETVLCAASWLAGTSLFRSLGVGGDLEPGTAIESEKANQEWPKLMKTFSYLLDKFGIKVKPEELTLKMPPEHQSEESLLQVQEALQSPYNEIMAKYGFDYAEGAKTGAVVCAMLVNAYCGRRKDLEPGLAASIVSMGFVQGAKTEPAKLRS